MVHNDVDHPLTEDKTKIFSKLVTIPKPPPLNLKPIRKRALVTVVSGKLGRELFEISYPSIKRYANRLDADLVILKWNGIPEWPISCKFQIPYTLDYYDKVLYMDCDLLIPEKSINLFEYCSTDDFYAYDDLCDILVSGHWLIEEYQRTRMTQQLHRSKVLYYLNTGIFVFNPNHKSVFSLPPHPIPPLHCAEQHWWVARLHDTNTKVKFLPKEANWQWWSDPEFKNAPSNAILHFSGMVNHQQVRASTMREYLNKI